jgi:hypothetical protein
VVSKLTFELPQQVLGVTAGIVNGWFGNVKSISHDHGATVVETRTGGYWGITLGSVIHLPKDYSIDTELGRHEFGHYLQSQRLGPAYLLAIGLPSILSATLAPSNHHKFYTERGADELSRKYFWELPNLHLPFNVATWTRRKLSSQRDVMEYMYPETVGRRGQEGKAPGAWEF